MSTIRSSDKNSSIIYDRLPLDKPKKTAPMAVSNVTHDTGHIRRPIETARPQPIYTLTPQVSSPSYAPVSQQSRALVNRTNSLQPVYPYYLPQQNYQNPQQPFLLNRYPQPPAPQISGVQSYSTLPVGAQYANSGQYVTSLPAGRDMYSHIVGLK